MVSPASPSDFCTGCWTVFGSDAGAVRPTAAATTTCTGGPASANPSPATTWGPARAGRPRCALWNSSDTLRAAAYLCSARSCLAATSAPHVHLHVQLVWGVSRAAVWATRLREGASGLWRRNATLSRSGSVSGWVSGPGGGGVCRDTDGGSPIVSRWGSRKVAAGRVHEVRERCVADGMLRSGRDVANKQYSTQTPRATATHTHTTC